MALKVKVKNINGKYLIEAEGYGWGNCWLVIDGQDWKEVTQGWMDHEPVEICSRRLVDVHDGYRHKETGKLLTLDEWNSATAEWLTHRDSDYNWDDLDAEYAYRKFTSQYEYVKHSEPKDEPCDVVRVNLSGRTDHPYISPLRLLQEKTPDAPLYCYNCDLQRMVREVGKSLGFTEIDDERQRGRVFQIPSHSGIRFMKINGKYCVADKEFNDVGSLHAASWDECEQRYNRTMERLRDKFLLAETDIEASRPSIVTLNAINSELVTLGEMFALVNPTKKSYRDFQGAQRKVDEIKKIIADALATKETGQAGGRG